LQGFVCCRLFAEEPVDSTSDCNKARISPLKNGTPNVSRAGELGLGVLSAADSSIEQRRSSLDTSLGLCGIRSSGTVVSADRPHSTISRPGREGIKLNSDVSRMLSLLKKQDSISSEFKADVQGLPPQSYVDKYSEWLYHGK